MQSSKTYVTTAVLGATIVSSLFCHFNVLDQHSLEQQRDQRRLHRLAIASTRAVRFCKALGFSGLFCGVLRSQHSASVPSTSRLALRSPSWFAKEQADQCESRLLQALSEPRCSAQRKAGPSYLR